VNDELGADNENSWTGWLRTRRGKVEAALTALCIVATVGLLVVLFRGSDDPSAGGASDPVPTTSAQSTPTAPTPQGEVEKAYRSFDGMLSRLNPAPNPDDPEIAKRTTGELRSKIESTFADRKRKGLAIKEGPQYGSRIMSTTVTGDAAVLKTCFVDQSAVVNAASGAEVEAMSAVTSVLTLRLVHENGVWKVARIGTDRAHRWTGVTSCEV
jgi:hypothetical protein